MRLGRCAEWQTPATVGHLLVVAATCGGPAAGAAYWSEEGEEVVQFVAIAVFLIAALVNGLMGGGPLEIPDCPVRDLRHFLIECAGEFVFANFGFVPVVVWGSIGLLVGRSLRRDRERRPAPAPEQAAAAPTLRASPPEPVLGDEDRAVLAALERCLAPLAPLDAEARELARRIFGLPAASSRAVAAELARGRGAGPPDRSEVARVAQRLAHLNERGQVERVPGRPLKWRPRAR